jgi:hypothetical protein
MNNNVIKFGALASLGMFVWTLIGFALRLEESESYKYFQWVSWVIFFAGTYLGVKQIREENGGFLSFGLAFRSGFSIGAVTTVVSTVLNLIYVQLINPEYINIIMRKQRAEMEAAGKMSEEQIDMAMSYTEKFMQPLWMSIFMIVFFLIGAAIISAIVAAFVKKDAPKV